MSMKKIQAGFTFIELLVALAVLAILSAMAAPAFNRLIDTQARGTQMDAIRDAFRLARGSSLSKSQQIVICSSDNQSTCAGSTDWSTGWVVFIDRDSNLVGDYGTGSCALDEDCLLWAQGALSQGVTLRGDDTFATFAELGARTDGVSTLRLCSEGALPANDTDNSHTISIVASGALAISRGALLCP